MRSACVWADSPIILCDSASSWLACFGAWCSGFGFPLKHSWVLLSFYSWVPLTASIRRRSVVVDDGEVLMQNSGLALNSLMRIKALGGSLFYL